MKEIHARLTSQEDEMKLYMEVADKKFNGKVYNFYITYFVFSDFYLEFKLIYINILSNKLL